MVLRKTYSVWHEKLSDKVFSVFLASLFNNGWEAKIFREYNIDRPPEGEAEFLLKKKT